MTFFLFKKSTIALIAAFLGAVSFNLVHISHFGRPWSAALFFFILAVYLALKQKSILSCLTVGLSYGFHQVGILVIPLVLLLSRGLLRIKNLFGVMIMAILIVIFSSLTLKVGIINSIEKGQSFLKSSTLITDLLSDNYKFPESISRTLIDNLSIYFIINFLVTDGIILIFGIWGILKVLGQNRNKKILALYLISYFLFASFFFHPLLRYLLPLILLLIPFAAYGLYDAFLRLKLKYLKFARWVFLFTILALASINSLWWNLLYLKTPTFIQTHNWINKNIPADVPIAYVGGRYQTFAPNRQAANIVQQVNPLTYSRLLAILPQGNIENVRNILYTSHFGGNNKLDQFLTATSDYSVEYIIDYYLDPKERLYSANTSFELVAHFDPTRTNRMAYLPEPLFEASSNFPTYDDKIQFSMYGLERTGPYFDILKVKSY